MFSSHPEQGPPSPYAFEYNNQDENGTTLFRKESSDGKGTIKGSYGYRDAFGTERFVEYVADENGYRAQIRTNEPGIESRNPAGVQLNVTPLRHSYETKSRPFSSSEKPNPKKANEAPKVKQSFKQQGSTGQDSTGSFNTFSSTKKQSQAQQQAFSQPSSNQTPLSPQKQQGSQQAFNTFTSTQILPNEQQHTFRPNQDLQSHHQDFQDSTAQGQFNMFTSSKKQHQTQQQVFSQPPSFPSSQTPQSTFDQSQSIFNTQPQTPFGNSVFSRTQQTPSAFGKTTETRPAFIQSRPSFVQFHAT
ncbi:uncharacterized protein LOC129234381 [Uloborus diversus]|uniref:uncharacterized protein LOC129234381 n=1 Tax=Uloborus diversus TaxID=327109 RepID=UPI00240A1B70|nr:uncharacterized protein LOC129234381 [Uloborus diversus]